jgi:hypothetical protein
MLPRIGVLLVGVGLTLLLAVLVMMVTDGLAPGRVAPLFAAGTAAAGGLAILAGLGLLEKDRDPLGS